VDGVKEWTSLSQRLGGVMGLSNWAIVDIDYEG
jgi:hypothetical protein